MNAYDAAFPPSSVRLKLVDLVRPEGQAARSYFSLVSEAKPACCEKCRQRAPAVVNSPAIQ